VDGQADVVQNEEDDLIVPIQHIKDTLITLSDLKTIFIFIALMQFVWQIIIYLSSKDTVLNLELQFCIKEIHLLNIWPCGHTLKNRICSVKSLQKFMV